jgi:hypothetical protein
MAGPILLSLPFVPADGNTLIAVIGSGEPVGGGAVTSISQTGASWVPAKIETVAGETIEIWYAQNISGVLVGIAINLVAGSYEASAEVIEVEGLRPTAPAVDKTAGAIGSSDSPDSGTTALTYSDTQLWVAGLVAKDGLSMSSPTNGFDLTAQQASGAGATDVNTALLTKAVSLIGIANTGASLASPTNWAGALATFFGIPPAIVIANRTPAPNTVGGVQDSFRFSLRSQGYEIDRTTLEVYVGAGPLFYEGNVLPENVPGKTFSLETFTGVPPTSADAITRAIEPSGELKLTKSPAVTEASTYFFGRLEAPADAEAVLMGEFTLRMNKADQTPDGNDFTGVHYGFFANDSGLAVKFFTDGATQKIEIHDADTATTAPPSAAYIAAFDWEAEAYTYKLLWDPLRDVVRLYVSIGEDIISSDELLIEGLVSDFPTLPAAQIRPSQPIAFFGHTGSVPVGISYWSEVSLQNVCSAGIVIGVAQGEYEGFIETDNETFYDGSTLPRDARKPWTILPDIFGTIEGGEFVTVDQSLKMVRSNKTSSFGYFRVEPEIGFSTTVVDFNLSGRIIEPDPLSESSGIEVYIDDDAESVVIAFLQVADGTQFIGMLSNTDPKCIGSYSVIQTGWGVGRDYRIVFEKGLRAQLFQLEAQLGGPEETLLLELASSDLPYAKYLPAPGIGFLHNANSAEAGTESFLSKLRYMTRVTNVECDDFPPDPWKLTGPKSALSGTWTWGGTTTVLATDTSGVVQGDYISKDGDDQVFQIDSIVPNTSVAISNPQSRTIPTGAGATSIVFFTTAVSDSVLTVDQLIETQQFFFFKDEADFVASRGLTIEFQVKIDSIGMFADDGTTLTGLIFADAGPPLGKVIYLFTDAGSDQDQNLLDIRSGLTSVEGTFAQVDWSEYHLYRLERTVGGRLRLFIDNSDTPEIDFAQSELTLPPTSLGNLVAWGALNPGVSNSSWKHIRYSLSTGFDVELRPVSFAEELRFDHAFNVIVKAEDTAP